MTRPGPPSRRPLTRTLRASKQNAVYAMHGYHLGKKPHDVLIKHIRACTQPGEVVLDPFCGSGSTALAAALCGRRAIAVDASPAAAWIARFYLRRPDPVALHAAWDELVRRAEPEIEPLYATACHHCRVPARTRYTIYSNVYACASCAERVPIYAGRACPRCRAPITTRTPIIGYEPVATCFACANARCGAGPRCVRGVLGDARERGAFESIDLPALAALGARRIPRWHPRRAMMDVTHEGPWGDEWAPSRNVRTIAELFTHRNLWALSVLWHHATAMGDDDLRAILTAGMLAVSRKAQHLDGGGGYIPGHWALPPVSKQRHVLDSMGAVARRVIKAKALLRRAGLDASRARVECAGAADLSFIPARSVDYVLTDPPYGPLVQYAELNCLWEAWLDAPGDWRQREIIVNRTRQRTEADWGAGLLAAMRECRRVLKPGRWLSLCYHDTSPARWAVVQTVMSEAGFTMHPRPGAIDTGGRSYVQHTSDKPTRRELVWHFESARGRAAAPLPARVPPDWLARTVRGVVRRSPCAPDDVVYDRVIAHALRAGALAGATITRALFERALRDARAGTVGRATTALQRAGGSSTSRRASAGKRVNAVSR